MFAARTNWKLTANRCAEAQARVRAAGREVLDLTASNPTQIGLLYDTQAILTALVSDQALRYAPEAKGLLTARRAVAQYYRERDGTAVDPESVFLTASTSEAYSFVFRLLCEPGDEILVPAPSYPLFEFLANIQDVQLVPYPLIYDHGWQMDLHALQQAITPRTRAVIVVHPNNPTGSFVKPHEAAGLSKICARNQLAIVADEVFLDFALDGVIRRSFAANQSALTFTLSGLSKISALPQMKLAWIVASGPPDVTQQANARLEVIADTYLSVNTPIQLAAPTLLEQRHAIQRQLNGRVLANLAELDRRSADAQGTTRLEVDGGWYAVLRVPVTRSDEDLAIELLEREGILVHPGHFYDFPRDGYLVLSLITSHDEFAEGVKQVLGFLK
jgi:aspartate/methionine/tyrosine aminotransferase